MTAAEGQVWFVTGASRGLGRAIAEAALKAGHRVITASRTEGTLTGDRLVHVPLDVTDWSAVFAAVDRAAAVFGGLDVVVNNAGVMLYGMVEEATEAQVRTHFDVNFFGALWVAQAVLPHLKGGGRLLQVTSMGSGGGMASVGFYAAGKAALDALTDALAMEVERFGVHVTNLQMGGYATDLFTGGTTTTPDPAYQELRKELEEMWGDDAGPPPETAAPVVLRVATMPEPPRRLIVGGASFDMVRELTRLRAEQYARWEGLSRQAPG